MLSYLACLKILEHQQTTESNDFDKADLARVLYGIARVLHDKEEYHDALHMYQRALVYQRSLAVNRSSLEVITTLCNVCRCYHLTGEFDEALKTNKEAKDLASLLVGGNSNHPFLIHRLKVEGNILIEAGRLADSMQTFCIAARCCSEEGGQPGQMVAAMMEYEVGGGGNGQEDAHAGDSSVLTVRSASALTHINTSKYHAAAAG